MTLQAGLGLEPLIIIGVIIGSAILQAISKRKKDAEGWEDWPSEPSTSIPPRRASAPEPVVITVNQHRKSPPPLPKKVRVSPTIPPTLVFEKEGPDRYLARPQQSQHVNLQERVEERMAAIDRQRELHVPTAPPLARQRSKSAARLLENFRRPETVQQAFLASFVLNPPKALE